MTLVGVGLLLVGGLTIWRAARTRGQVPGDGRYRSGPWPGLSPAGAAVLLGGALLLGGGQLVLGDAPRTPLPELPLLAVLAVWPMALATRLVGAPGAASAVSGAYLLPRALLSLFDPTVQPPPLLLVPALVFDVCAWLSRSDLANLRRVWPGRQARWRRRGRVTPPKRHVTLPSLGVTPGGTPPKRSVTLSSLGVTPPKRRVTLSLLGVTRHVTPGVTPAVTQRFYAGGGRRGLVGPARRVGAWRAAVAGALFGGVLTLVEAPFAVLLGADPAAWSAPDLWLAGALAACGCGIAALAVSGRGTGA